VSERYFLFVNDWWGVSDKSAMKSAPTDLTSSKPYYDGASRRVCSMRNFRQSVKIVLLSAVSLMMLSCAQPQPAPVYVKDGKAYGKTEGAFFRHRWWNFYERGLSYAEGKYYQDAVSDFKQALEQRAEDQRMARTYGMHFLDYFPHRELGVVYYEMGALEAAKNELELSLGQFPSAKTYFYLDQVRKKLIEREGKEVEPPNIVLDLKDQEIWTRDDPVVLSGTVENDGYVSAITIRERPLFLEGAKKRVSFKEPLQLSGGIHPVAVEAKNLMGMVAKRTILFHVDREGPLITLEEVETDDADPEKRVMIKGSAYDEAQVVALTIGDRAIPIQKGAEIFFTERLSTKDKSIELVAQDRLGNETRARVTLFAPAIRSSAIALAYAAEDLRNILAGLLGPKSKRPPVIELKGLTDLQTVYLDKVYIEGEVIGESKIESLTINESPIFRHKGLRIFFNHLAELKEGKNTVIIAAKDEAGNTAEKTMTIERRLPEALQLNQRMSLTVLPFEQKSTVNEVGLAFQDNLTHSLVNRNRFRVVERSLLDKILEEQKLSQTKLIERSTALSVGRLAAAQSIITGSIVETRQGIEAVEDLEAVRSLAEGMAVKFHREFPLVGGTVIKTGEKFILTDLGQDKIKLQRRLIVYREEPVRHPVTGKLLGADTTIIARARVTQVSPEMSKSELTSGAQKIQVQDKVITE
jgi:tetratricopeptide (TPR) repeat protein